MPREDLTFTERIELLREHRTSWSHPERLIAEKYDLNPDPLSTYKYIGGVFAQGLAGGVWPGQPTYNMRFHQLPSKNLGTGFKEWAFYDLGTGMVEFTIDPDQNLFALIEFLRPDHPSRGPLEFRIHLKTLDTNEPHPGALLATLATTVDPVLTEAIELEQQLLHVHSEISGAVLATSFAISEDSLASWVVVYDWRRGTELTVSEPEYPHVSVCAWPGTMVLQLANLKIVLPIASTRPELQGTHVRIALPTDAYDPSELGARSVAMGKLGRSPNQRQLWDS